MNRTRSGASGDVRQEARFIDLFHDDVGAGEAVGSTTSGGVVRRGVDAEGVIGIDHGALRIRPMVEEGWGRSAITYGPYDRQAGLMFAAFLLNGHNTSQSEVLPETMRTRLIRWLNGHGRGHANLARRFGQWLRHPRRTHLAHKIRVWRRMASGEITELDENLAVGWFTSDRPSDPSEGGNVSVMHAALGNNGELWVRSSGRFIPVTDGIQNVPMCYVTILRARGACYYLASVPGAHGAGTYPSFRPCGVDTVATDGVVFGGIHQASLGQVGFRVDTRVYGVQVEHVESLATWYGTAHSADTLSGDGQLDQRAADIGGTWSTLRGGFDRRDDGAYPHDGGGVAVLNSDAATGLIHVLARPPEGDGWVGLVWRFRDLENHYRIELNTRHVRLRLVLDGETVDLAEATVDLDAEAEASVQILDDGRSCVCIVNGVVVFGDRVELCHLASGVGAGICAEDATGSRLTRFETHPLEVDLSDVVELPAPWFGSGDVVVIRDDFGGPEADLDGHVTTVGDKRWQRQYGAGRIYLTGDDCAAVDATIHRPNPGSTAYTVGWDDPRFVDVAVDVTPPGTGVGQYEKGRGGLVLLDDPDNFLTISMYVDDSYDGASIAIFSHLDGFEDIYDAVWSMVAKKIYWGATHRLRVVCDGDRIMILIDDEPVLYRAITDIYSDRGPIALNRVGLAVNWEWGDDTGTTFANFTAKARSGPT